MGVSTKEQEEIFSKYPSVWFNRGDMTASCMFWGLEVGAGWLPLIDSLFSEIQDILHKYDLPDRAIEIVQVKEKFGGLRVYYHMNYLSETKDEVTDEEAEKINKADTEIFEATNKAEDISSETCEVCGRPGSQNEGGWISTLCNEHREERGY